MVRVLPKWGVFENCHYEYRKKLMEVQMLMYFCQPLLRQYLLKDFPCQLQIAYLNQGKA